LLVDVPPHDRDTVDADVSSECVLRVKLWAPISMLVR
jgi:hypothetical protein